MVFGKNTLGFIAGKYRVVNATHAFSAAEHWLVSVLLFLFAGSLTLFYAVFGKFIAFLNSKKWKQTWTRLTRPYKRASHRRTRNIVKYSTMNTMALFRPVFLICFIAIVSIYISVVVQSRNWAFPEMRKSFLSIGRIRLLPIDFLFSLITG